MYKVFDIHTHTYPEAIAAKARKSLGDFYDFYVEGLGTYADLEGQAAENNVKGYLLFSVCTNAHQVEKVNSSIAELAAYSRSRGFNTVGFAGMHQDFPNFEAELERCKALGLKGVKIHPDIQGIDIDSPKLFPLYELLEGNMPLYLHMGDNRPEYRFSEAKKLAAVLDRFPHLEVVAAHLGGYRASDEALEYLAGRDNVWYDTSSALWDMTAEKASMLIHRFGSDRVMFGTDYPVKKTAGELDLFMKLDLNETERQNILYYNALRFLHLDEL